MEIAIIFLLAVIVAQLTIITFSVRDIQQYFRLIEKNTRS